MKGASLVDAALMTDQLLEAWRINHRVNLLVIDGTSDEGMRCTLSKRGGRNVVRQFAHIHNVRVYQLTRRAKGLAKGIDTFASKDEPNRKTLVSVLNDSAARIEEWLRLAAQDDPSVRTQKRGVVPTLGYLIAHESHHRGSILLTLKQCGHAADKDTRYGIWDWNNV